MINDAKTDFLIIGTRQQLEKTSIESIIIGDTVIKSLMFVPKVNCSTLGDRAFAHAAPVLWNSLPLTIRTSTASPFLKSNLKHFFLRKLLICWNSSNV